MRKERDLEAAHPRNSQGAVIPLGLRFGRPSERASLRPSGLRRTSMLS